MRAVKLLLVEGMPGAGKSTLAQGVLRQLGASGVAARWWYEEDAGHPVYCFRNAEELRQVVADLGSGQHGRVIAAALEQWRAFAASVAAGDEVVVLDGCLFGYLTWSLFPFDVPDGEILAYVAEVASILSGVDPCVVSIRTDDVAASWRRLFAARGEAWARSAVERVTKSPYGERRGLVGFEGLVAYWQAYQGLVDEVFARLSFAKLALGMDEQGSYLPAVLAFLGVTPGEAVVAPDDEVMRFAGRYMRREGDDERRVEVAVREGALSLVGVPELWPQNRLVPVAAGEFVVEAFPFRVRFGGGAPGRGTQMVIDGPDLLGGVVTGLYVKEG
ncbi:MAG: hypothetical protein U0232_04175 [Thermomicrobiales bacterium]